ncbi:hypothetical protein PFISCL1PPCAC_3782 [Pristionchus fissidentatus]|uniref:Major facilitator superfamily (MFS) profile domain-containing protein n=1 Tax=Pristionchus fissidentatus TaxID=1538716 RepID=A0AAV5UYY0_9BILA|nr:hypothetical protein PFISCL1PPCAC_3782 [Pristionchus fissidentatus]
MICIKEDMVQHTIKRYVSFEEPQPKKAEKDEKRRIASVIFLTLTQLTMSFDAVAQTGISSLLQNYFNISDSTKTTFSTVATSLELMSMLLLFLFGDRLPRKHLMTCSIAAWLVCNILSLFSTPGAFWLFLLTRTVSSACWSMFVVLCPVIISDMFKDEVLGKALMFNSLANYLGSVISSSITSWFASTGLPWQAGLIPGPILVMVLLLLLVIVMPGKRHHSKLREGEYLLDTKNLFKIKSFLLLTFGASFTSFYFRAHGAWLPSLIEKGWNTSSGAYLGLTHSGVSSITIIIELLGVIIGLPLLVWIAESMQYATGPSFFRRHGGFARAMPAILFFLALVTIGCSVGELASMDRSFIGLAIFTFFLAVAASPFVTLITQMLLNVAPPKQRASAIAATRLVVGLLAGWSAQLVGMLSDILRGSSAEAVDDFRALRISFYTLLAFLGIAAMLYFALIKVYPEDVIRSKMLIDFEDEEMDDEVLEKERKPLIRRQRSREPVRQRADTVFDRLSRRNTLDAGYALLI